MNPIEFGWNSEQACWNAGYDLLVFLRALRYSGRPIGNLQDEPAEAAIAQYCQRLRRSDRSLKLPRIQRDLHVPDYGIVLLMYCAASFWSIAPFFGRAHEAVVLAVGFCPTRLIRVHRAIDSRTGFCRLMVRKAISLEISREFYDRLGGSISEQEVSLFKHRLASLPIAVTKPDADPAVTDDLDLLGF